MGGDSKKPGPGGSGAPTQGRLLFGETTIVLHPDIGVTVDRALAGDERAWARLYGQAGALIAAQRPIPEPLAKVIAHRMAALAEGLSAPRLKDVEKLLHDLVVPSLGPRRRARKPALIQGKTLDEHAAEAVLDLLKLDNRYGRRKALIADVARRVGRPEDAVRKAMTVVKKRRAVQDTRASSGDVASIS